MDEATGKVVGAIAIPVVGLYLLFLAWLALRQLGKEVNEWLPNKCPGCDKEYTRVCLGERVVAVHKCYALVTRYAHSDSKSYTYEERAPVIRTTYEKRWECKSCRWAWSKKWTKDIEDFERA